MRNVSFAALLLLAVVGGCDRSEPVWVDENGASGPTAVYLDAGDAEAAVSVAVASWEEIQATIAKHTGKVVVVDLWSTSCVPCLRELPKLAELQEQHPETVACISVNIDYIGAVGKPPESYRDTVMKRLEESESTCQNFLSSTSDSDVYEKINLESEIELASIPAVFVYDRDGKLLKRFDNDKRDYGEEGFTYADHIGPLVEKAMARQ